MVNYVQRENSNNTQENLNKLIPTLLNKKPLVLKIFRKLLENLQSKF